MGCCHGHGYHGCWGPEWWGPEYEAGFAPGHGYGPGRGHGAGYGYGRGEWYGPGGWGGPRRERGYGQGRRFARRGTPVDARVELEAYLVNLREELEAVEADLADLRREEAAPGDPRV